MTVTMFIMLLTAFSTLTGLCTEGIKKLLDEQGVSYASNLLACIVGLIVGVCGTAAYYVIATIPFSAVNVVCMVLMGVASAVGAMVGYDKLMQMLKQLVEKANK